jgi:hypothetical protein
MSAGLSVGAGVGHRAGTSAGISAVLAALDAATAPVHFYIRDDDAGWDDERLFALLRCTERARVPIDLAVIPQATGVGLAAELRDCVDGAGGRVGLHQHGHAHRNFEPAGRKCEFGPSRDLEAQCRDLTAGREHLHALFGARLDAFFTPPWNRCADVTPGLLAGLGYTGLSRDRSAPPQQALPELRVDVDWCRQQRLASEIGEPGGDAIGLELARHVHGGAIVGLMLHHAQMSDAELGWLGAALSTWSRHPNARWRPMRELLHELLHELPPLEPLPPLGEGWDGGLHAPHKETT